MSNALTSPKHREQERISINQQIEEFFNAGKTISVLETESTSEVIEKIRATDEFKKLMAKLESGTQGQRWNRNDKYQQGIFKNGI